MDKNKKEQALHIVRKIARNKQAPLVEEYKFTKDNNMLKIILDGDRLTRQHWEALSFLFTQHLATLLINEDHHFEIMIWVENLDK